MVFRNKKLKVITLDYKVKIDHIPTIKSVYPALIEYAETVSVGITYEDEITDEYSPNS